MMYLTHIECISY